MPSSSRKSDDDYIELKPFAYMQLQPYEYIQLQPEDCERLVSLAKAGNAEAFNKLHEYYGSALHDYLAKMMHDKQGALDLAQDTFLKAWLSIGTLHDNAAFKPWLFRIGANKERDWARKRKLEHKLRISCIEAEVIKNRLETTVENQATELIIIQQALLRIPEKYRRCFLLRVIGGFKPDEIAKILGIKKGNIHTYLMRAATKLVKELECIEQEIQNDRKGVEIGKNQAQLPSNGLGN